MLSITLLCIAAFIITEIHTILPCPPGAAGWTLINAIGWFALWLVAEAHVEIAELGDFTEGETWDN